MLLRYAQGNESEPLENTFEAVDEVTSKVISECKITVSENEELFPKHPVRIFMELTGKYFPDALLGAAVARAKEIAKAKRAPSRVFAGVRPENTELLESLKVLGLKDDDALLHMRRLIKPIDEIRIPAGCTVVRDFLDDPVEQKYFLERVNRLYGKNKDFEWLRGYRGRQGFLRILIVSPNGMVGETAICQKGDEGVIEWIYVSKKWRGMHVAHTLLDLACDEFDVWRVPSANAYVQVMMPQVLGLTEHAGFECINTVWRYPGVDIDL